MTGELSGEWLVPALAPPGTLLPAITGSQVAGGKPNRRAGPPVTTELIRRGVPIEVVARLLTHRSSTTTTQTYIHLDAVDVREALTRAGVWQERRGTRDERPAAGVAAVSPGRLVLAHDQADWVDGEYAGSPLETRSVSAFLPAVGGRRRGSMPSPRTGCATRRSDGPGSAWPPGAL